MRKGLGQIIFRAVFDDIHNLFGASVAGNHHHGNNGLKGFYFFQKLFARLTGQAHICNDQIIMILHQEGQSDFRVFDRESLVTHPLEHAVEEVPDSLFIIDHQNFPLFQ